jgi:tRNA G10  N-methylase Trm11
MNQGLQECNKFFLVERDNTPIRGIRFSEYKHIPAVELKQYEQKYLITHGDTETIRRKLYSLYYSSISNFRPAEAIRMYEIAQSKVILDPCAGWGGRCFGAMHFKADYIGFDTNTNLKDCYNAFIKEYNVHNKNISIHFEDSSKVDYSKYTYDTVLTSPPYYKRELYNHMPNYKSPSDFNNNFLKPMICNVYKHLSPGGHMFINLPQKYYAQLTEYIGRECDNKYEYRKTRRNTTKYAEYIYCWIKRENKN